MADRQQISIDGYAVDALISEELQREGEATQFPVEKGTAITDHFRLKPNVLRVQGVVSDTPIGPIADLRHTEGDFTPRKEAELVLNATFEAGEPIVIITGERTYRNMLMTALSAVNDGTDAFVFNASFQEIDIEENTRTVVKVKLSKQDKGNRAAKPPGWIGTDSKGRDIIGNKLGPGVEPSYTRADGTAVTKQEAAAAARRNDSVIVKYDKDGHAVPVDNKDYQPYTPKQKKPYWAPTPRTP